MARRVALALVCVAALASGCKRAPRDRGKAGAERSHQIEPEARARIQMMIRVDFKLVPKPILEMMLPTALRRLVDDCGMDFVRDLDTVEVEIAGPLQYRLATSGKLTRTQVACGLEPILTAAGRGKPRVTPRGGGGLEVMTPDMPVHTGLRNVLMRRMEDAPKNTQVVMVVRGGEGGIMSDTLLWLGETEGALRIRFASVDEANAAKQRLESAAGALAGQTLSIVDRELVIAGPVLPLTMALGPAVMETFGMTSHTMAPTLLPGDDFWFVKGPFMRPLRRGDVVVYNCIDKYFCAGRVRGLAGDRVPHPTRDEEVDVPAEHVLIGGDNPDRNEQAYAGLFPVSKVHGRAILVWWSQDKDGNLRWDRVWKVIQ